MGSLNVGSLGEYIREQRRNAQYSLRQLAEAAGVSNPYLSQIERGLRKPSAEILQQIARALRISAESLYVQAGILDERDRDALGVQSAILADPTISERQKQVLLQIYESFRKENGIVGPMPDGAAGQPAGSAAESSPQAAPPDSPGPATRRATTRKRQVRAAATEADKGTPVKGMAKKTAKKVARKVAAARAVRAPRSPSRQETGGDGAVVVS